MNSETSYHYRVKAFNDTGDSVNYTNSASATTGVAAAISLSANGYKDKGTHNVDLTWSGASGAVDIKRDGNVITSTNNGFYSDNIGTKGGATYIYEVCEPGSSDCSDEVTVIF